MGVVDCVGVQRVFFRTRWAKNIHFETHFQRSAFRTPQNLFFKGLHTLRGQQTQQHLVPTDGGCVDPRQRAGCILVERKSMDSDVHCRSSSEIEPTPARRAQNIFRDQTKHTFSQPFPPQYLCPEVLRKQ